MSRTPLDITKTLYDSDGYRHTLVRATPLQILTLVEGFYWLWDRRSGRCLVEGMGSNRLSNTRPPGDDLQSGRDPVAETRAFFIAQKAVRTAAASAGAVLAHGSSTLRPTPPALLALAAPRPAPTSVQASAEGRRARPGTAASAQGGSMVAAALMVGFLALALLLPTGSAPAID